MIEIILGILLLLCIAAIVAMVVIIKRLVSKVEFYEGWIEVFKYRANSAYELMKSADIRGSFEADDEVGDIFKTLKAVIDDLEKFTE